MNDYTKHSRPNCQPPLYIANSQYFTVIVEIKLKHYTVRCPSVAAAWLCSRIRCSDREHLDHVCAVRTQRRRQRLAGHTAAATQLAHLCRVRDLG